MTNEGDINFEVSTNFCDKCGTTMKKNDGSWLCPNCDYTKFEGSKSENSAKIKSGYFTAEINNIDDHGHGKIETEYQHIDAGPIQQSAVGSEVTALLVRGKALVRDGEPKQEDYIEWMVSTLGIEPPYGLDSEGSGIKFCSDCAAVMQIRNGEEMCPICSDFQFPKPPEPGQVFTAEVNRISNSGNSIIDCKNGHINLGPFSEYTAGTKVTALRITNTYAYPLDKKSDISVEKLISEANQYMNETEEFGDILNPETTIKQSENESGDHVTDRQDPQYEHTSSSGKNEISEDKTVDEEEDINLRELRQEAKANAVEKVSAEAKVASSESPEYNRSEAVKRYAKARAAGVCEGCGAPAPFTSKTGEPYLHAHHVNELSDGGTDTIDSVIALCPNCHYRVHDGEDGKQYNKRLRRILQEIEARS